MKQIFTNNELMQNLTPKESKESKESEKSKESDASKKPEIYYDGNQEKEMLAFFENRMTEVYVSEEANISVGLDGFILCRI